MSDELNAPQALDPNAAVAVSPDKKPGLLSTPGGKVVAIVVGLAALGIIAGIAVAIVLVVFGNQAADDLGNQIVQPATDTGSSSSVAAAPQAEAPAAEVANSEVFTFRNIFVPLVKPPVVETAGTSTAATDSVTPTTQNTLYLDGVVTRDGVLSAVLLWNGQTYTLAPGGVIPNSPWEVLRVSSTSVTMLYGENQVTLSVGQGIAK